MAVGIGRILSKQQTHRGAAHVILEHNFSMMGGHDLPAQAESNSAALPFSGEKRDEYLIDSVVRYARTIVPEF